MDPLPQPVAARPRGAAPYPSRTWRAWLFGSPLQTADAAEQAMLPFKPGIVITNVPYHVDLDQPAAEQREAVLESA